MRPIFVLVLAGAALGGCGGDDTGTSAAGGATSGGPDPTAPNGAVSLEVYATEAQSCPYASLFIEIGNVKATPPVVLADGESGTTVTCSVAPHASGFAASGSIAQGDAAFGFADVVTDGASAIGSVSFLDPADGTRFQSAPMKKCVFQFAPSTAQGIEAGRVHVQFDCPELVSEADPAVSCSARYGYVLLDNCEGKPAM